RNVTGVQTCALPISESGREQLGEPLQVQRPTSVGAHRVALALPALAVPIELAVLQLDPRPLGALGDEAHLDLTGLLEIGLDLPLRVDVPAEHDTVRRLVGEHSGPSALAPVDPPVVDVAAH